MRDQTAAAAEAEGETAAVQRRRRMGRRRRERYRDGGGGRVAELVMQGMAGKGLKQATLEGLHAGLKEGVQKGKMGETAKGRGWYSSRNRFKKKR